MKSDSILEISKKFAKEIIYGLNESITPYHAVDYCRRKLVDTGFREINEKENWSLKLGEKYFYTRNNSCLVAFSIGGLFNRKSSCFKVIGAHTDSPNLRFAPNSYAETGKFERFNVQLYGGGIWQTWFDRDLSVAGKVIIKDELTNKLTSRLIRINYPILRIPNLAIHLTTERNKFEWNNESHLKAVMSTTFFDEKAEQKDLLEDEKIVNKKLGFKLANLISRELNVQKRHIVDFDLCLYDTQESCLLGIDQEFVSSGRLDNLGSSLVSVHALINDSLNIANQSSVNFIALFDNEEVGSLSFQGADSEFFGKNLERIFKTIEKNSEGQNSSEDDFLACCARSFVLSADMAHAFHPNYSEKYHADHRPLIHGGITIKINPQTRYATDSEGSSILKEIAKKAEVPFQEFIVKQDSPCGTTIGPIISGKLGIKTADVGIPQFAMHSIREMCGVCDLEYYRRFFEEFFKSYENCVGDLIDY